MIDIKKTRILEVYATQKDAVEARNMKCNSFTRAIQQQSVSSGHYWILLKSKLYMFEQQKRDEHIEKNYGDKGQIAWGSQIRSYVMQPYQMVKDHRTDFETGNVNAVLDGDLDGFIESYLRFRASDVSYLHWNTTLWRMRTTKLSCWISHLP